MHCAASMRTLPAAASGTSAGQPSSRTQRWQPTHLSASTALVARGLARTTHGLRKTMALTPGSSATRRTVDTAASRSSGSTVSTIVRPTARSTRSMLTFSTTWPIMVRPVPGCG